jgi:4-hydroxybenzoate polyprenyltransferase
MLAISLVFGSFLTILFLIVGIVVGWNVREYMINYQDKPKLHPEFYDKNGNVIADEVVAITFNPDYFCDDDFDDDEE